MVEMVVSTLGTTSPRRMGRSPQFRGNVTWVTTDFTALPPGLPEPQDDGATDHLPGMGMPALTLDSSMGPVDLAELAAQRAVIYLYPKTGTPGEPLVAGWDEFPGARGCTPESCGFRDHAAELAALGARVAGLSGQTHAEQVAFADRNRMPFPVIADPDLRLREALSLPTFELHGVTYLRRLTLVAEGRAIVKAFYPVFPPDRHAAEVLGRRGPLQAGSR
jgi:peroxiredoxin